MWIDFLQMLPGFIVVSLLFLPHGSTALMIDVCNCSTPAIKGFLDTQDPIYCSKGNSIVKTFLVSYDILVAEKPVITWPGYICLSWRKTKKITGYFFGSFDTEHLEQVLQVTPEECWRIVLFNDCDGNKMTRDGSTFTYERSPEGSGSWWRTVEHNVTNCAVEIISLNKECSTCPVRSKTYGILQNNSMILNAEHNHHMFVWRSPPLVNPDTCVLRTIQKGDGRLFSVNNDLMRLVDVERQLEYIYNVKKTHACNQTSLNQIQGIPSTFIILKTSNMSQPFNQFTNFPFLFYNKMSNLYLTAITNLNGVRLSVTSNANLNSVTRFLVTEDGQIKVDDDRCVHFPILSIKNCAMTVKGWMYDQVKKTLKYKNESCIYVDPTRLIVLLKTCDSHLEYQQWSIIQNSAADSASDSGNETDGSTLLVEHHQFMQHLAIDRDNVIANEVQRVYCEFLKMKRINLIASASVDGMMAARQNNFSTCTELMPVGETLLVRECVSLRAMVNATLTRCGYEPLIGDKSLSKDGYTLIPRSECIHKYGVANLNGKPYTFINGGWEVIAPNIHVSTLNLVSSFDEKLDLEFNFIPKIHKALIAEEIQELSTLNELLTRIPSNNVNALTSHFEDIHETAHSELSFNMFRPSLIVIGPIIAFIIVLLIGLFIEPLSVCVESLRKWVNVKKNTVSAQYSVASSDEHIALEILSESNDEVDQTN